MSECDNLRKAERLEFNQPFFKLEYSNSMSIHPGGRTIPLQFVLNLYSIFIVLRHVKLQNSRLVPLIVFELQDFKFWGFLTKMGVV